MLLCLWCPPETPADRTLSAWSADAGSTRPARAAERPASRTSHGASGAPAKTRHEWSADAPMVGAPWSYIVVPMARTAIVLDGGRMPASAETDRSCRRPALEPPAVDPARQ